MSTRKIKDAKDLSTDELIYFRGHAGATYMSNGLTVEEAINSIVVGDGVDLSDYYTKTEVDNKNEGLQEDLTELTGRVTTLENKIPSENYVTELMLENKGYITIDDVEVNKSYLENNYYNKSTIDKKIAEAGTGGQVNLDGYATTTWVIEQGFLTNADIEDKLDDIEDLDEIRSNAALAVTAIQEEDLEEYVTDFVSDSNSALEATLKEWVGNQQFAAAADLAAHTGDEVVHITTDERENWNKAKKAIDTFLKDAELDAEGVNVLDTLAELQDMIGKDDAAASLIGRVSALEATEHVDVDAYKATDTLAKANAAAIEVINSDDATVEGSIAKAKADAINAAQEKIEALNLATTYETKVDAADKLAEAISHADSKTATAEQNANDYTDQEIGKLSGVYATITYVQEEIAKAQLEGEDGNLSDYATTEDLKKKQDIISDIDEIRSGAALGKTSVQHNELATSTTSGLMSSADKTKLDNLKSSNFLGILNLKNRDAVREAQLSLKDGESKTYIISDEFGNFPSPNIETIYLDNMNDLMDLLYRGNGDALKWLLLNKQAYYKVGNTWYSQTITNYVKIPSLHLRTAKVGDLVTIIRHDMTANEFYSKYIDYGNLNLNLNAIDKSAFDSYLVALGIKGLFESISDGEAIRRLIEGGYIYTAENNPEKFPETIMNPLVNRKSEGIIDITFYTAQITSNTENFYSGLFWTGNMTGPGIYSYITTGRPTGSEDGEFYTGYVSSDGTQTLVSMKDPSKVYTRPSIKDDNDQPVAWTRITVGKNSLKQYYEHLDDNGDLAWAMDNTTYWAEPSGEVFNDYINNYAHPDHAHAEGLGTKAYLYNSHAEGFETRAGHNAHSEGSETKADGQNSHAEGSGTQATNNASHAEGLSTSSLGEGSHSEGIRTVAQGNGAHAEGYYTNASGDGAHAEGQFNYSNINNLIHSVGIGGSANSRKNAHVITTDGKHYIYGIGEYKGLGIGNATDLATIVNKIPTNTSDLTNDSGFITIADVPTDHVTTDQLNASLADYIPRAELPELGGSSVFDEFTIHKDDNGGLPVWVLIAEITNLQSLTEGGDTYGFTGMYNSHRDAGHSNEESGFIVARAFYEKEKWTLKTTGKYVTPYIVKYEPNWNSETDEPNRYWIALRLIGSEKNIEFIGDSLNLLNEFVYVSDNELITTVAAPEAYIMPGLGLNVLAVESGQTVDDVEGNTYLKYSEQSLTDSNKEQARKNIDVNDIHTWYKSIPTGTVTGYQKDLIGAGAYPVETSSVLDTTIKPNVFYDFGDVSSLLTVRLGTKTPNVTNEYMFLFKATSLNTSLIIRCESGNNPKYNKDLVIASGYVYLISILNDYATFLEFKV